MSTICGVSILKFVCPRVLSLQNNNNNNNNNNINKDIGVWY